MGFLRDGVWHGGDGDQIGARGWEPRVEGIKGLVRAQPGPGELPAQPGRYHLIVCPGCPLSHRIRVLHRLKRLDDVITIGEVRPVMGANGREFDGVDPVTGASTLHDLYLETRADFSGRDSTPVLWDRVTRRIVSNTYRDILAMLNREFDAFTASDIDVQPAARMAEIDAELARLGAGLLGAVYRAGFSRDQTEYERQVAAMDRMIPELAAQLADQPYLLGDAITEPDLGLFATLVRYDAIYLPLFRCTRQRIEDHPALTAYIARILALPGVAETFDLAATMTHYYGSHVHLNPTRIVPLPPPMSWLP